MINYKKYVFFLCLSVSAFGQEEQETNFYTKKQFIEDVSNDDKRLGRKADYFYDHYNEDIAFTIEEVKLIYKKSLPTDSAIHKTGPLIISQAKIDLGELSDVDFFKIIIEIQALGESEWTPWITSSLTKEFIKMRAEKKIGKAPQELNDLLVSYGCQNYDGFQNAIKIYNEIAYEQNSQLKDHEEYIYSPASHLYQGIYEKVGLKFWTINSRTDARMFLALNDVKQGVSLGIAFKKITLLESATNNNEIPIQRLHCEFSGLYHTIKGIYNIKKRPEYNNSKMHLFPNINSKNYETFIELMINESKVDKRAIPAFVNSALVDDKIRMKFNHEYNNLSRESKSRAIFQLLTYLDSLPPDMAELLKNTNDTDFINTFEDIALYDFERGLWELINSPRVNFVELANRLKQIVIKNAIKRASDNTTEGFARNFYFVSILYELGMHGEAKDIAFKIIVNPKFKNNEEDRSALSAIFHQDFGTDRQKWLEFLEAKP